MPKAKDGYQHRTPFNEPPPRAPVARGLRRVLGTRDHTPSSNQTSTTYPPRQPLFGQRALPGRPAPSQTLARSLTGWLFIAAGFALFVATWFVPEFDRLSAAQHERDTARAIATWQEERLRRYAAFVADIDARDPTTLTALAASQLNLVPESARVIAISRPAGIHPTDLGDAGAIYTDLEPELRLPIPPQPRDSYLGRLARDPDRRLWLLATALMLIMIGAVGFAPTTPKTTTNTSRNQHDAAPRPAKRRGLFNS